jgi:hypothetical protein
MLQVICFCIALWNWHFRQVDEKGLYKDTKMLNPIFIRKRFHHMELTMWREKPWIGMPKAFSEKIRIYHKETLEEIDKSITSVCYYRGDKIAREYIDSYLNLDELAKIRVAKMTKDGPYTVLGGDPLPMLCCK